MLTIYWWGTGVFFILVYIFLYKADDERPIQAIKKWRIQNCWEYFEEPYFISSYNRKYWIKFKKLVIDLVGRFYVKQRWELRPMRPVEQQMYFTQSHEDFIIRRHRENEYVWRTQPLDGPTYAEYDFKDFWEVKDYFVEDNPAFNWGWRQRWDWLKEWKGEWTIVQIWYVLEKRFKIVTPQAGPNFNCCDNYSKDYEKYWRPFGDGVRENEYKETRIDLAHLDYTDIVDEDSTFKAMYTFKDFYEFRYKDAFTKALKTKWIINLAGDARFEPYISLKPVNWSLNDKRADYAMRIRDADKAEFVRDKFKTEEENVFNLKKVDTIIDDRIDMDEAGSRLNRYESQILERTLDNIEESTDLELLEYLREKTFKGIEGLKNTKLIYNEECQEELTSRIEDTAYQQFHTMREWDCYSDGEFYNNARIDPDSWPRGIYRREMTGGPMAAWCRDYAGWEFGTGNAPFMKGVGAPFLKGGGDPFREDLFVDQEDVMIQLEYLKNTREANQHSGRVNCNNRDIDENISNTLTWDDIFGIDKWVFSKWQEEPLELFLDEQYSSWDCFNVDKPTNITKPSMEEITEIFNSNIDYALQVADQIGWGVYSYTSISDSFNWIPLIMINSHTWVNVSKPMWIEMLHIQCVLEKVIDDLTYYYFTIKPWVLDELLAQYWHKKPWKRWRYLDYWPFDYEYWFATFCLARAFEEHIPTTGWPLRVPLTTWPDPEYNWPIRWYSPLDDLYNDPRTFLPQRMVDKMYGFYDDHEHWYSTLIRIDKNLKDELESDRHYPENRYPWGKLWWNRLYNNAEVWSWIFPQ